MLCKQCKKSESVEGKTNCAPCLEYKRKVTQSRNDRLRAAGICRCGKAPIISGTTCCEACRVRRIKYVTDRSKANVARGLCPCGKDKPVEGKSLCTACGEISRKKSRAHLQKNMASGLCYCCGKKERVPGKTKCEECRKKHRQSKQLANYGLHSKMADRMLEIQKYKCPLCDCNIKDTFVVDHDHETGKVRGLLCHGCNTFLGKYEKREPIIDRVKAYLAH